MSNKPEILEEKEMSMYEVKEEISKIKKREAEVNFRVQKTDEYLNTFTFLKQKEYKELVKKLKDLEIPRLNDKHILKIVDILPLNVDELKVVMQGYPLTINNDNLKKLVKTIKDNVPEKE
jgi:DNA-directed RNA polymerase subunit F